ncbi:MAG TPA: ABC transporter ATP-binding protein, partial [Candidatus Anaeromassilibacillus stercoravium]|nr:ABC transporter ATP-binding protein [Candidatus Anaeromassilibacillus stercoravium]
MEKLCLEVQDLTKHYDASEFSLDHLNFKVPYGSVMGLIGENGAGKTTTLKLILNLMRRDAGTIKLFGLDNIRDEGAIKQQIGVVFDENHFHELFSPADIAKILRSLYQKWDDNLFQQYLRRFQLPADKPIKTYSRGMKVKLSIASALAHHPKLLLLDEPTSGL